MGALPTWPYAARWGTGPAGILGVMSSSGNLRIWVTVPIERACSIVLQQKVRELCDYRPVYCGTAARRLIATPIRAAKSCVKARPLLGQVSFAY
jgi:hypothetical protein